MQTQSINEQHRPEDLSTSDDCSVSFDLQHILHTAEPGVVPGSFALPTMADEEYHLCHDYVSSTGLKALTRSPAHFNAWRTTPRVEVTPSQRLGKALHCALLEPERFDETYQQFAGTRRGKAWQNVLARYPTCELLTEPEMRQVLGMQDAILNFHAVDLSGMLNDAKREYSIFWRDERTGLGLRLRADALHPDVILDIKTATDARPPAFKKQARQNLYHLQAAHYMAGCHAFSGLSRPFWLIAVETAPPHGVWIHEVGPQAVARAEEEIQIALAQLQRLVNLEESGYMNPWATLDW